jgi:hydroxyacylglutathione hydrolase
MHVKTMHIEQFISESLGDASYLVASEGVAAVIDPQRDIRPYLEASARLGVTITHVFETHVHNDYVSGGPELAARGATIVAPRDSGLQFAHTPIADGEEIVLGAIRLRAMHAPGHTHHHTAYLGVDEDGAVRAAFTGGSIIIGGAGRSDLLGPAETEALTRLQWESVRRIEAALDDSSELLPTHGAGSFCSTHAGSGDRRASLAVERPRNVALSSPDFASFRHAHLANPGPIPAYYRHMAPINRHGPQVYGTPPRPVALSLDRFDTEREAGAAVVDVRDRFSFAAGHIGRSLSIEEGEGTLAYVSWVTDFNSPVVLVTHDQSQADRVTVDLLRIGYEEVRGFLPFEAWATAARPLDRLTVVDLTTARAHLAAGAPTYDVRFDSDRHDLPLAGSVARPIDRITEWLGEANDDSPLIVCGGGSRATTVASVLQRRGQHPRVLIDGGAADLAGVDGGACSAPRPVPVA